MPKTEYVDLEKIPSGHRGAKAIDANWVAEVKRIPVGKAMVVTDLKYTTIQGRLRHLKENKTLDETYTVMSRKVDGKAIVYIAHTRIVKTEQPEKQTD